MELKKLRGLASPCRLCGRRCGVNRSKGEKGFCEAGACCAVYSYSVHHGEEPPISGARGSGTIFFTHCNMECVYCQNYSFSQEADRRESRAPQSKMQTARGDTGETGTKELAQKMLALKRLGCHNINLVSPTHYAHKIVEALGVARKNSLDIPVVYNTGGYDSPELIKLLDGIVDIYMPDMRYADDQAATKYSSAPGYVEINREIIKEMYRQVGELKSDDDGVAQKGVLVRLLILPNNVSGTKETLRFLKDEFSGKIYISVMSQYHPVYNAPAYPEISRRITQEEYRGVIDEVERLGFENGYLQGYSTEPERFLGTRIRPGRFNW